MATVKFQLLSKNETASIYLRLSINRKLTPRAKTGLYINPKDWGSSNFPKTTIATNKKIKADLQKLEIYVLDKVNEARAKGVVINTAWLKFNIDLFFGLTNEMNQDDSLITAIQNIIDEAPTRKNAKGGLGISKSRINSYISVRNIIAEYQSIEIIKVKDVDMKFAKNFLKYLLNTKNYQKSTALKKLADLKTVCADAEFYGIETNPQFKKIQSGKPNNENILYLNHEELKSIEEAPLFSDALSNARIWLLLGCNIGQRGSDLLLLNETNFVNRNGLEVIELKQQKTGKNVTIPVLKETKEIIKTGCHTKYRFKNSIGT